MHTIGHVGDRHFRFWPVWEEGLEKSATNHTMESTNRVYNHAPANGQPGHIERLGWIGWIGTTESQEILR